MRVAIIGAGAFGTALACALVRAGREVMLWTRNGAVAEAINDRRENPAYLPGHALPDGITAVLDFHQLSNPELVLLVTPAQYARRIAGDLTPHLPAAVPIMICAKGIEQEGGSLLTDALGEIAGRRPLAVLSGPTFAVDLAAGRPCAVTVACVDQAVGGDIVRAIGTPTFRPYLSDDPVAVQVGGAVKNVIAIACGIAHGMQLGESARAALITRGLTEVARLAVALGGRGETLMGLSGLGDLVLTCSSLQSRNMSLGAALGMGRTLTEILAARNSVAEGVATAAAIHPLAARHRIEMPISAAVHDVLHGGQSVQAMIDRLLPRPYKMEGIGGAPLP